MARPKMIKEVEVKFSPAFEKAINGKVKTKKTKKAKTKKAKATAKPRKARAKSKYPRGYKVVEVEKTLRMGGQEALYTLIEVSHPKMDKARYFVDELSASLFISGTESESSLNKSFDSAVKRASTKSERKELQAAKEINELAVDGKPVVEKGWANYFNGPSIEVEETIKNNEDIDA